MQAQDRTAGTDLWFVTDLETHKLDELAHNPHVNLGFYDVRDGGPDDPRLALILVGILSAQRVNVFHAAECEGAQVEFDGSLLTTGRQHV